jgi:hypothetical protein
MKLTTHPHLVPRSKNAWSYTPTPPIRFQGVALSETQGQLYLLCFTFTTVSRPALGSIHPLIQWVLEVLYPGVKRSGREAGHTPPSSADVKNAWSYTSTLPIFLHSVILN